MKKVIVGKLIKLPDYVWQEFEQDALRCRRSTTKHLEAVLVNYLGIENTEMRPVNNSHVEKEKCDQPSPETLE